MKRLAESLVFSDPEDEMFLSYMDMLMTDCFSPTFPLFFFQNIEI